MTKERLTGITGGRGRFDAPLAPLTTFGLGGPAAALAEPESVEELAAVLALAREAGLDVFILGGGSNVLFRDGGFDGVVIRLGKSFAGIEVIEDRDDVTLIRVGAAERTPRLLSHTREQGLAGLEFLAGIPGRVGGAIRMNAGTVDGSIDQALERMEIMLPGGQRKFLEKGELDFGYRSLELPEGAVILAGDFALRRESREAVAGRIEAALARRAASQPKGVRSAGCVFRNPPGDYAGRLIDRAGLKGRRIGGAWIAQEHANFIVHKGEAAAGDVIELMEQAVREVQDRFGVRLENEIVVAGIDRETGQ